MRTYGKAICANPDCKREFIRNSSVQKYCNQGECRRWRNRKEYAEMPDAMKKRLNRMKYESHKPKRVFDWKKPSKKIEATCPLCPPGNRYMAKFEYGYIGNGLPRKYCPFHEKYISEMNYENPEQLRAAI